LLVIWIDSDNPDPLAKMGRSDIGSSQHSPSRIKPQRGQVSENHSESSSSEHWRVFHKRITGSYFTDDSRHLQPEPAAFSGNSDSLSGCADVLTGKPARYHVNTAAPWSAVKGAYVIPYRERREKSVILPGEQYARSVGVPLNGTDCSPAKQVSAKYSATSACE
jgi:hypothetical protein